MKRFAIVLLACLPVFGAGSVNQTIGPLGPPPTSGPDTRVYLMQLLWTGDSVNGTVPATVINISQFPQLQGMRVISVEIQPNSPSPTSGYSLTLVDQNGIDLLAGAGGALSATVASSTTTILSPPLVAAPTFNVSGNSVASARGQLLVYFSPVSQIVPNSGPGLTTNNTFSGTNTFTGVTTACNQNNILYVGSGITCWAGSDIGSQINSAYAALPATGGRIHVVPSASCYSFTTPINFTSVSGKVVILEGDLGGGSCLNYTPTTATTAITFNIAGGLNVFIPGYGMSNLYLTNNNCTTNGGCGSSATGVSFTAGTVAVGPSFTNVLVGGFGTGMNFATGSPNNAWGAGLYQAAIAWNTTGISIGALFEQFSWYGGRCIVNTTCMTIGGSGADVSVYGVSFDANTTLAISNAGILKSSGNHYENSNGAGGGLTTHYISTSGQTISSGDNFIDDQGTGNTDWWINATAGNLTLNGSAFFSGGRTATQVVQYTGASFVSASYNNTSPAVLTTFFGGTAPGSFISTSGNGANTVRLGAADATKGQWNENGTNAFFDNLGTLTFRQAPGFGTLATLGTTGFTISANEATVLTEGTSAGAAAGVDSCYGDSTLHALKCSYNNGTFFQIPQVITATSAAFATATTAGTCVQSTTAVTGATTAMAVSVSPVSTPGVGAEWSGFVSSAGNVTINECAVATSAGGTIAFNIRVTP